MHSADHSDPVTDLASPPGADAMQLELSVVMPCLNEAETIGHCVRKAQSFLQAAKVRGEVVVADNGSSDDSRTIAVQNGARVVAVAAKGYGSALMGGIEAARGRYIIMGDADDSYDFTRLMPFLEKLRAGCELVMGNRFRGGLQPGAMPLLHRYLGNPVLTAIGRLFFHSPLGDFHCGLRGFSKAAYERMALHTTGMEFASEMVVKASLLNMAVAEVPTILSPDGRSRPPHLRTWRDGWRHLRFLLLYCPRWLFLYPGLLLIVAGSLGLLWLWPGSRHLAGVSLGVHTILYAAAAVMIGFQAVSFSMFAKVFAISAGFLPEDASLNRLFRRVSLEAGLGVGLLLILLGLGGSLYAVRTWGHTSFGSLDPAKTMRTVIPAVLGLVLGCQVILSSFFLSLLGMKRKGSKLTESL